MSGQSVGRTCDRSTFYGGGAAGYTDYPALEKSEETA